MVLTTHIFLFYFLPLFLGVYFILPRGWRNLWITLASYIFYGWWEPWFVCLMLFTTVMDFMWGKVITRSGATPAHISLSSVLRDYLYFPLGGNRKGPARTYFNLAVVMLLGGLWHGAKWNFVVWGAYHGVLLGYERWRDKKSAYTALPRAARIGVTFLLMLFSWVLFREDNLDAAWRYFGSMFGLMPVADAAPLLAASIYTPYRLLVLALCALLVFQPLQAHDWAQRPLTWPRVALATPVFVLSLVTLYSQAFNPFLYFQF